MKNVITVDNLSKTFRVRKNTPGILGALKGLVKSKYSEMHAIDKISFSIKKGERIVFIGPNGAGKSTTIKMLTSILMPTLGLLVSPPFNWTQIK